MDIKFVPKTRIKHYRQGDAFAVKTLGYHKGFLTRERN